MRLHKLLIYTYIILSSTIAMAFVRTPSFPNDLKKSHSVANWYSQNDVFLNEKDWQKQRPIWILAGDSISAAWSSEGSIEDRYEKAKDSELPIANSIKDMLEQVPSPKSNWYSGSDNHFGLFGFLDPEWADAPRKKFRKPKWAVVATAFAGATLMPDLVTAPMMRDISLRNPRNNGFFDHDTFDLMKKIRNRNRVRLVTLSLGGNDVCDGLDVQKNETAIRTKLRAMKALYPTRGFVFVPWKVPQIDELHRDIKRGLANLPENTDREMIAKNRVINYCKTIWEKYCPAVANTQQIRKNIVHFNKIYREEFGLLFDPGLDFERPGSAREVLERLSKDCFHPSANLQVDIRERLENFLRRL